MGLGDAAAVRLCGLSLGSCAFSAAGGCGVDVTLRSNAGIAPFAVNGVWLCSCGGGGATLPTGFVNCESVASIACRSGVPGALPPSMSIENFCSCDTRLTCETGRPD